MAASKQSKRKKVSRKGLQNITGSTVEKVARNVGDYLGYDTNYPPIFPKGRRDVAAIRRMTENGSTYGYDTIYLVWKVDGELCFREVENTKGCKDYMSLDSIVVEGDKVKVQYGSGGIMDGTGWTDTASFSLKSLLKPGKRELVRAYLTAQEEGQEETVSPGFAL